MGYLINVGLAVGFKWWVGLGVQWGIRINMLRDIYLVVASIILTIVTVSDYYELPTPLVVGLLFLHYYLAAKYDSLKNAKDALIECLTPQSNILANTG